MVLALIIAGVGVSGVIVTARDARSSPCGREPLAATQPVWQGARLLGPFCLVNARAEFGAEQRAAAGEPTAGVAAVALLHCHVAGAGA